MDASRDHIVPDIKKMESREMILRAECPNDDWSHDLRSTCFSKATVKPSAKQTDSRRFELEVKREDLKRCREKLEQVEKNLMKSYAEDKQPKLDYYFDKLNFIRKQKLDLIDSNLEIQAQLSQLDKEELQKPVENAFFPNRVGEATRKKTATGFFSDLPDFKNTIMENDNSSDRDHNCNYQSPEKQGFTFTISDDSYFKAIREDQQDVESDKLRNGREVTKFDVERKPETSLDRKPLLRQKMDSEGPSHSFRSSNIFLNEAEKEDSGLLFGRNPSLERSLMRKTFRSLAGPCMMEPERVIRNIQKKRDRQSRELVRSRDSVDTDKFSMAFLDTPKRSFKDSPVVHELHEQNERLLKMNKPAAIACKRLTFKSSRATMNFYVFPESALHPIPTDCLSIHRKDGIFDEDCDSTESVVEKGKARGLKFLSEGLSNCKKGPIGYFPRNSKR